MPDKNGQKYICFLPKVEKAKSETPIIQHNVSSMIVETEKRIKLKTPDELLEALKDRCFIRVSICILIFIFVLDGVYEFLFYEAVYWPLCCLRFCGMDFCFIK